MTTQVIAERSFRDAMGSFATGVCVLGAKRRDGVSVGMTVNSFTSVSLDPPLILVCLGAESPRSQAIIDPGRFAISVLADDQRDLSNHFATQGEGHIPDNGCRAGENGAPIVERAAAIVECDVETTYKSGDHMIVIGRVTHIDTDTSRAPLLYFRGKYRHLDGEIS